MTDTTAVAPIHRTIAVDAPIERAWEVFTTEMTSWWPRITHTIGEEKVESVGVEPHEGGRLYERWHDGTEHAWGRIKTWDPPNSLTVEWNPTTEATPPPPTEWEIRFTEEAGQTRVDLEHRGWEHLPHSGPERRASYAQGWPGVLEAFQRATR